jgi:hypothetical protein
LNFAAKTFDAWRFKPEELMLIKVDKPASYKLERPLSYRTMPDMPERWTIDLVVLAKKFGALLYAPFDLDSRPDAGYGSVFLLICKDDCIYWEQSAKALNTCFYKLDKKIVAGCYGLSQLLSDGEYLYWKNATRHDHNLFLHEMMEVPPRFRGAEVAVYETFAVAQIIAGDKLETTLSTFCANPNPTADSTPSPSSPQSLLQTLKDTLESTGWDDAKADFYAKNQFGVPHWDELQEAECKRFLTLLENVLESRKKLTHKP